jgi:drug/metabolite transporter (DMT)-like permease
VNGQELAFLTRLSAVQYGAGLGAALLAVAAWTWYPLFNDRHLKQAPHIQASTWATAQGLATLVPAAVLFAAFALQAQGAPASLAAIPAQFSALYWTLMLTLGFGCSWLGTLFWNAACQRLPAAVSGQLIVFETLAALALGYAYRGQWPSAASVLGIALLVAGVLLGVRGFTRKTV